MDWGELAFFGQVFVVSGCMVEGFRVLLRRRIRFI